MVVESRRVFSDVNVTTWQSMEGLLSDHSLQTLSRYLEFC